MRWPSCLVAGREGKYSWREIRKMSKKLWMHQTRAVVFWIGIASRRKTRPNLMDYQDGDFKGHQLNFFSFRSWPPTVVACVCKSNLLPVRFLNVTLGRWSLTWLQNSPEQIFEVQFHNYAKFLPINFDCLTFRRKLSASARASFLGRNIFMEEKGRREKIFKFSRARV